MSKIGILGGAFDPPHIGHLLMASIAAEEIGLDSVLFIPTGAPPHGKVTVASPIQRLAMTRRATEHRCKLFKVRDIEICRIPEVSYTVDTVGILRGEFPDDELFLIMGDDEFESFERWVDPMHIASMARIVCIQRHDWEDGDDVYCNLDIDPIIIGSTGVHWSLSSSNIRRRVSEGKDIRYLVPDPVLRYIEEFGLYA